MMDILDWLDGAPIYLLGLILLTCMIGVFLGGRAIRAGQDRRAAKTADTSESQEGYIVSAVLGLLALLMGFTFALAVDRFDARRHLVREEANAIGTAYLRAQLLGEPHRTRLGQLLIQYTDNRIVLAKAHGDEARQLLAIDQRLVTDIWAATAAAYDSVKQLDFSSTFVDSMNEFVNLNAARVSARAAKVPAEVFHVLFIYLIVTAGILGYVLVGRRRVICVFPLALLTLSLLLIIDIDRPTMGGIRESQFAMEQLQKFLKSTPPSAYDRWRGDGETTP